MTAAAPSINCASSHTRPASSSTATFTSPTPRSAAKNVGNRLTAGGALYSAWKSVRARSGNVESASSCTDHVPPAFGSNRVASNPVSRTSPARIGAPRATPLREIRAAAMNGCPFAYPA